MKYKWEEVGSIGVDAGLCWVGDPCYILHKAPNETPKAIGRDWGEFCDRLGSSYPIAKEFNNDIGGAGFGVCVSTGYGDGCYPVFVKRNEEGRIVELKVKFD